MKTEPTTSRHLHPICSPWAAVKTIRQIGGIDVFLVRRGKVTAFRMHEQNQLGWRNSFPGERIIRVATTSRKEARIKAMSQANVAPERAVRQETSTPSQNGN